MRDRGPGRGVPACADRRGARSARERCPEATIITRFDGYAGKYVFHCHNLEHEDMAMMGNLVTVN
jgi:FtsP/CotA-like multicopper oxidase with cupredoxin domain